MIETDIIAKHVATLFLFWLRKQTQERKRERMESHHDQLSKNSRQSLCRCSSKQKKNIIRPSSKRRSKITTKATSGGPTQLADRFGECRVGKAVSRHNWQLRAAMRHSHRGCALKKTGMTTQKKSRQLATLQTAAAATSRELQRMSKQKTTANKQTRSSWLAGWRSLALYLWFDCMGVRCTHSSPTSRRLLTCFCGGQREKRG